MAQNDPWAAFNPVPADQAAQPVAQPGSTFVPAPGAAAKEARETRGEVRDVERLGLTAAGEARAGREEIRGAANALRDAFEKQKSVTDYQTALPAYSTILDLAARPANKANDFTIITLFNKIQDPGSAVLQGERTGAQDVSTLFEKYKNQLQGVFDPETGFVSDDARRQFVQSAQSLIGERRRAYDAIRTRYSKIAGSPEYGVSADIIVGPDYGDDFQKPIADNWGKIFKAQAQSGADVEVTGKGEFTPEDIKYKTELEQAWAGGASVEDIDAIAQKYNRPPFPQDQRELLRGLKRGSPVRFEVNPTGKAPTLGSVAESPAGAYFVGAANALTSGAMDELAPALGLDERQVQLAKEALREKYPVSSFAGEVSGSVLQQAGLGKAIGAAGIAAPRAATAAGLASGVSYGAGEAPEGERLKGAAIGLGGALAGEGLGRLLLRPGAREAVDAAADRAGVPPEALEQVLADIVPPSPRQVIEAGAETGIPIMTSDVRPPRTFIGESARRMGERVPFVGTGGARAAQQEARADAVSSFLREQDIPDDVKARIVTDLSETRKADITKYTQLKEGVFNGLRDAGPVPASNTLAAIDKQIAKLSTAQTEAADEAIAALNQIRENVQGRDILAMEAFRADELANAWKKDGITPGAMDRIEKAVKSLYGPFNEDMGAFIKEAGGATDYNKWRVANARLAEGAQEVTQTALKNVLRTGNATPEVIDRLLFSAKKSDVARLYRNLSPVGRSNARLAIIERIGRDMGPEVSPEKFVTALRRNADQAGIFFTGEQAKQAAGLVRALQATRRGAGARLATATGQENYAPIAVAALADAFGGGGAASAALGTVGISSRIYESAAIRNLLVKLGEVKAGSMAEGALLRQLGEAFPKAAATIGATRATETAEPDVRVIPQ